MIFTFVDLTKQTEDPLVGHLVFYLVSPFPPRIAEGTIIFDFKKPGIVYRIQIKEQFPYTIEESFKILFALLAARNLVLPFATHQNSALEQKLLEKINSDKTHPGSNTPTL
jgi:hypothetical protein